MNTCSEILCETFSAEVLPGGKVKLRIFQSPERVDSNGRMTIHDVVDRLREVTGREVSINTVYQWTYAKKNRLPSRKLRGKRFFIANEIEEWIGMHLKK